MNDCQLEEQGAMGQRVKPKWLLCMGWRSLPQTMKQFSLALEKKTRYFPVTEIGKEGHANHGEQCYQDALNNQ